MGRFSPGPYRKGVPNTNAGEDQPGGPKAQFGKRLSPKTDDRATYGAGEMGIKSEDQSEMGKHGFKNQAQTPPVGEKSSYSVPTKGKGPGVPRQPQYDLSNRSHLDDSASPGPYTRSDGQGLLNDPRTGEASKPIGGKGHIGNTTRLPKRNKPHRDPEADEEGTGEWPLKQKSVAAHLRSAKQFRGE